jgi:hypothetical protein
MNFNIMTTKEAFKALCNTRGALTKACRLAGDAHPSKRAAEIRWRIKHKSMWPHSATLFMLLTYAGYKCENGKWVAPTS